MFRKNVVQISAKNMSDFPGRVFKFSQEEHLWFFRKT